MRFFLTIIVFAMAVPFVGLNRSNEMQEEVLKIEDEFGQAMIKNDSEAIGRFRADDWIIINPDGGTLRDHAFLTWSSQAL